MLMMMLSDVKRNVIVLRMMLLHNVSPVLKGPELESKVWVCHSNAHSTFPALLGLEFYQYSCNIWIQNGAHIM